MSEPLPADQDPIAWMRHDTAGLIDYLQAELLEEMSQRVPADDDSVGWRHAGDAVGSGRPHVPAAGGRTMKSRRIILAGVLAAILPIVALAPAIAAPRSPLAKCAPGRVMVHKTYATSHGTFLVEATEVNEFEFSVCSISPSYHATKQQGTNLAQFGDGTTFKTDSLGHVFYNLYPGQVKGVGVIVFIARHAKQLGIYDGGQVVQHKHAPFAIRRSINNCRPSCAAGHVTHKMLTWHPKTQDYRAKG